MPRIPQSPQTAPGLSWRDGFTYALAALSWIALSAASALALLILRSAVGPLVIAILYRDSYYQVHYYLLVGKAGVADRVALGILALLWIVYVFLLEDYLRSSISEARAQRAREASVGASPKEMGLRGRGLEALARRSLLSAAFPAIIFAVYLVLQGALLWLTRG